MKVTKKMMPELIATNSIGGHTLRFSRRRNTWDGWKKMSITSSQKDDCAAFAGAVVVVDSVIFGREGGGEHEYDTTSRRLGTESVSGARKKGPAQRWPSFLAYAPRQRVTMS